MTDQTITVTFTVDEARALYVGTAEIAHSVRHLLTSAQDKLYAALVEAGEFEGEK